MASNAVSNLWLWPLLSQTILIKFEVLKVIVVLRIVETYINLYDCNISLMYLFHFEYSNMQVIISVALMFHQTIVGFADVCDEKQCKKFSICQMFELKRDTIIIIVFHRDVKIRLIRNAI